MDQDMTRGAVLEAHDIMMITNHAHVLAQIAMHPKIRMREIAAAVGITERAVQRIVDDLTENGYITVTKDGRRNQYTVQHESPLLNPATKHRTVGDLIGFMSPHSHWNA